MTSKIDHGGFAFPTQAICTPAGDVMSLGDDGMTLRDWFAGRAAQSAIAGHISHYGHENHWLASDIASYAYDIADAMIAARKAGA